eukprot:13755061-Alexandrium_andersonii.AAC.1
MPGARAPRTARAAARAAASTTSAFGGRSGGAGGGWPSSVGFLPATPAAGGLPDPQQSQGGAQSPGARGGGPVSYTHLRAHETSAHL